MSPPDLPAGGRPAVYGRRVTDTPGWPPRPATDPHAAGPYAADPYAAPQAGPYATAPYATAPYATDPYATDPYATDPYPTDPYALPPSGYLPPGHAPVGWGRRPLVAVTGLSRAVVAVGAVWLLLAVVEAVTAWSAAPRFSEAAASGAEQPWTAYDTTGLLVVLVQLVGFVLTGLWLTGVRRNVDAVAPGSQRRGVVWAWLGWFVPVVSLWFPYQVVADAGRASTRATLAYGGWWATFLAFLVLQQVQANLLGGYTGDVDASLVQALPFVAAGSAALLLVAFVLWTRIVLEVSAVHARWAATQVPTPA